MKKGKILSCLFLAGLLGLTALLGGCTSANSAKSKDDSAALLAQNTAFAQPTMPAASKGEYRTIPEIDEGFLKSVAAFCADSSAIAAKMNPENNLAFSPVSLYMALAMTSMGAEEETLSEMLTAFHMGDLSKETIAEQSKKLFESIYFENETGKTYLANSIWVDDDIREVKESFYKQTAESFYAPAYYGDLQSQETQKAICDWVAEQTNGKVERKIPDPISDDWAMSLINAIYFIDRWSEQFSPDATETQPFWLADGKQVEAQMMKQTLTSAEYKKTDEYESIAMRFNARYKMTFYLPVEGKTADNLLAQKLIFADDSVSEDTYTVNLSLPRFDIKSEMELSKMLKDMGIERALGDGEVDFSGISDEDMLFISSVVQAAAVTVDEEGCEAAAYTEVIMDAGGVFEESKEITLLFNRPFAFSLTDSNDLPLFTGVVQNPAEN